MAARPAQRAGARARHARRHRRLHAARAERPSTRSTRRSPRSRRSASASTAKTDAAWKVTTLVVILVGAGTALYTLGVFLETLVEGRLTDRIERRRTARRIAAMQGHVIVCGWGRVGRTIAAHLHGAGHRRRGRRQRPGPRGRTVDGPSDRGRRHRRRRAAGRGHRASGHADRGAQHRRRQPLRHAVGPRDPARPVHRGPRPHGGSGAEAGPGGRQPGGQPAEDRRCPHGGPRRCSRPWPTSSTS